jgi:hypothetical protein
MMKVIRQPYKPLIRVFPFRLKIEFSFYVNDQRTGEFVMPALTFWIEGCPQEANRKQACIDEVADVSQ